jgi:hypothetical protein
MTTNQQARHTESAGLALGIGIFVCVMLTWAGTAHSELKQADMHDIEKLVEQHRSATRAQRQEARDWMKGGAAAVLEKRWDLAGKMYLTAALVYPTFVSLKSGGEAVARSDRRRDTLEQSLVAQRAAFGSAAQSMRTAILFAEKVPGQASVDEVEGLRKQIACIDSYDGKTAVTCEPVASVLKRYRSHR